MNSRTGTKNGRRRSLLIPGALALLLTVTGCADLKLSDEDLSKLALYINSLETTAECGPPPVTPPPGPVTIRIVFVEKNIGGGDTVWCPEDVLDKCPLVFKGPANVVKWESVDAGGGDLDESYKVVLTPFMGDSFESNPTGVTVPQVIKGDAPRGVYKYTVLKMGDNAEKCEPYDPVFYVN